jgi:hypothetical protein
MGSQQVQRSIYGALFVFMSLMKSLPMVARTKVLWRNTSGDWSVKDRTSCTENLHLGHKDDIVKIMQVEGAKCIITWGPTGAKARPNRAEMALAGQSRPAGPAHFRRRFSPPFLAPEGSSTLKPWRCHHSQGGEPFAPGGHPQARERGGRSPEGDQPPRRKHQQVEKKEDTVGRVTLIG